MGDAGIRTGAAKSTGHLSLEDYGLVCVLFGGVVCRLQASISEQLPKWKACHCSTAFKSGAHEFWLQFVLLHEAHGDLMNFSPGLRVVGALHPERLLQYELSSEAVVDGTEAVPLRDSNLEVWSLPWSLPAGPEGPCTQSCR